MPMAKTDMALNLFDQFIFVRYNVCLNDKDHSIPASDFVAENRTVAVRIWYIVSI